MKNKKYLFNAIEDKAIFWLAKINSSSLSEQQEKEFFSWLESSPLHQAAYIKAEQLWQRGEVLEKLSEPEKNNISFFSGSQVWGVACASIFTICIAVLSYVSTSTTHYEFQTAIGEQKNVQLADGSHLALNTNSKVDITFSRKSRVVNLDRGEVFFDVAADATKPFDVITKVGVVRVLGTHFAVQQTAEDAVVTVVEGKVALGSLTAGKEFVPISLLKANEQLNFRAAGIGKAPEKINAANLLSWRNKQLVYKGQPLSQVILDIKRYFPVAITLLGADVGSREITAVIKLADIRTTIQALCASLNLQAEFTENDTKITLTAADTTESK